MRSFFSCSAALIKFLQEDERGQKALFRHLHHPGFITASQGCAGGARGAGCWCQARASGQRWMVLKDVEWALVVQ